MVNRTMFDNDRLRACIDWYHVNLDMLLPLCHGKYVACTENGVVASGGIMLLAAEKAIDSCRFFIGAVTGGMLWREI